MIRPAALPLLAALSMAQALPLPGQAPGGPISISVNQADLKDILRAATADTDLNLIFEPGLDTRVEGLNLKAMNLQEILDEVLPRMGLACTRQGRNLLIQKGDGGLRFYHVDLLAMSRTGTKSFQVNGSGQQMNQGATAGTTSASPSAYTSSVQMGLASDPWGDLESGLLLLVFGRNVERQAGAAGQSPGGPGSRAFASDGKSLLIQPGAGLVGVAADAGIQKRVAAFLQETRQRSQRQVLLEARIVEVTLTDESETGMDWNGLLSRNGNLSASLGAGPLTVAQGMLQVVAQSGRVQATLSALARDNRLKVLSSPRLATLNNQKAILRVVTEQAYGVPSSQITPGTAAGGAVSTAQVSPLVVPVGIILDIQPQIGDDGIITLAVNPSVSDVGSLATFSVPGSTVGASPASFTLPVVDRRDLDTVVRVKSGETLVLAGIIRTQQQTVNRGVPWLRKLPVVGKLFANEQKTQRRTELAIFITPTLMEQPGQVEAETRNAEQRLGAAGADLHPPPPPAAPGLKAP